eukprot:CAMPEP_0119535502 /NCGR_PEP_ID=MMETSP1344-20130328/48532_1 /TAXON_ID=236787 /ORGANISM="Florenciella parvula, Strain CCMP2471" /LENGTH=65 /DNA_ID=CAMNT_0007577153 /DNA_START=21 /DNA_END=215 /DNA_ORIENTATION=-
MGDDLALAIQDIDDQPGAMVGDGVGVGDGGSVGGESDSDSANANCVYNAPVLAAGSAVAVVVSIW